MNHRLPPVEGAAPPSRDTGALAHCGADAGRSRHGQHRPPLGACAVDFCEW